MYDVTVYANTFLTERQFESLAMINRATKIIKTDTTIVYWGPFY